MALRLEICKGGEWIDDVDVDMDIVCQGRLKRSGSLPLLSWVTPHKWHCIYWQE